MGDTADALEPEIMDRQDAARAADRGVGELGAQIDRRKGGLPVMAVDHIRDPVHIVEDRQSCLGEIAVFGNILPEAGIGISPVKKLLVVNKIVNHAVFFGFHDANVEGSPLQCEIHHERTAVSHQGLILIGNTAVKGKDDADLTALADQSPGQGIHNISQAAGFHKGIAFRADEGNFFAGAAFKTVFPFSHIHLPFSVRIGLLYKNNIPWEPLFFKAEISRR